MSSEKYTPEKEIVKEMNLEMKASLCLTNIAALLIPQHIPDQKKRAELIRKSASNETVGDMSDEELINVDNTISDLGFAFSIDRTDITNFVRGADGNIYYIKTLIPWELGINGISQTIDEDDLREKISELEDPKSKDMCYADLQNLNALFEQEKLAIDTESRKPISPEVLAKIETAGELFNAFIATHDLESLHAIQTGEEARTSLARETAKSDSARLLQSIKDLLEGKLTDDQRADLSEKHSLINKAIGRIRNNVLHHD